MDRRPRSARGEGAHLRAEIIAAAQELLDQDGEDAVTLRAIARAIGISAPSIYRHFDDRQAILFAIAEGAFDELAGSLQAATDSTDNPTARLRAVCSAYFTFAADQPALYMVMFGGQWDTSRAAHTGALDADQLASLGAKALELIACALQRCGTSATGSPDDAHAAAIVLWVGLHGLAHQRLVAPSFPWPADIEERLVTALTGHGVITGTGD